MVALRSTVVMKTDIYNYTPRTRQLSDDELSSLLTQHKNLIGEIATHNDGAIVKGEGDAFWLVFPSVTAAALAAVTIQQELRSLQTGESDEQRLSIRVTIGLGDVLHQDNDIFGDVVNLTARISGVTPRDEIYLSQAAWLALNKAEIQTAFVNDFTLKGYSESVRVYRIEQRHRTRIIRDQYIVFVDVGGFSAYYETHPVPDSETLLLFLDEIVKTACEQHNGVVRQIMGDAQIISFGQVENVLPAVNNIRIKWHGYTAQNGVNCRLRVGVHFGDLNIFRSHLYGHSVNTAGMLASVRLPEPDTAVIVASYEFYQRLGEPAPEQHWRMLENYAFMLEEP